MMLISMMNALICVLIAFVFLIYQRQGATHRPLASAMAYVLIVAAGSVFICTVFGKPQWAIVPQMILNLALLLSVFGARGNVIDLFVTRNRPSNRITDFLRSGSWN